jgi:hypothetical protein
MIDIRPVLDRVYDILVEFPNSRGDDDVLLVEYLWKFHNLTIIRDKIGKIHIPKVKSMERCRRKVQEKYPELGPDPESARFRLLAERQYRKEFNKQCREWEAKNRIVVIEPKELRKIEKKLLKEGWYDQASDESTE